MTRAEISAKVSRVVSEALGTSGMVIEHAFAGPPKSLQDALGCTSLEIVSVQMAIEEAFDLQFATGGYDRGPIDEEWDACTSMAELDALVEKWTSK